MKIFYQRLLLAAVFSFINIMAFAQPGVLDQTFGVGGKIQINIAPYAVIPIDIKIQTDKKILVLSMLDTSSVMSSTNCRI